MSSASQNESASELDFPTYDVLFEDLALRREISANLVGFCRYLRMNGLFPGIGEQMDALRSLEEVDIENEEAFKMALRTTLAKSVLEQEIFDEHFYSFWYVWESAENLHQRFKAKKEEPAAVVVDERPQKQAFVSISDWLDIVCLVGKIGKEKLQMYKEDIRCEIL